MAKLERNGVLRIVVKVYVAATLAFLLFLPFFKARSRGELSTTTDRMTELVREAVEFRSKVGRNVQSTTELLIFSPLKPTNRILDGWGNEFKIEARSDGGIMISTYGEDNRLGGAGDGGASLPP